MQKPSEQKLPEVVREVRSLSAREVKRRERGRLYDGPPDVRPSIITPELRQALAEMLEDDPERFLKVCVKARVISLRQIPAWIDLAVSRCPEERHRALQIAKMADKYGIIYRQ